METGPRFKSHPKDWRSRGSNQRLQDCRTRTLTTAPRPLINKKGMDMERQAGHFNLIYPEQGVVG